MVTKRFKKRFGTRAVEEGFITVEQLLKAIKIQVLEDLGTHMHRPIGAILFEQGSISGHQINSLINYQDKNEFMQAGRILRQENGLPWRKISKNYGLA
jgi:hypothetical protein